MSGRSVSGSSYERLLLIGRGGMGEVYLGRQRGIEGFQRPVALKRILPGHGSDPELRRMFVNEARIMASLNHPNICQTVDLCTHDSDLFLVLELLDGANLGALVKQAGPLPTPIVGAMLLQACAGLEHAHAKGLVHRDLSPSNLFLTSDGVLKILDFGVAKSKGTERSSSGLKGNSPYMSPEQVASLPLDGRSDLFAIGAVGLEALSGTPLFLRDNDYLTYQAILEGTRPVGLTTSPLDPILASCLDLEPDARPQSARELAQAIRSALQSSGGGASPHDLTAYLEHHMAEELEARRTRRAEALSGGWHKTAAILHTVELVLPPSGYATTIASPAQQVDPGPAPAEPRFQQPPPARRHPRIAVALALTVALFAVVWLAARAASDGGGAASPPDASPAVAVIARPEPVAVDAAPPPADAAPPPETAPDAGAVAVGGGTARPKRPRQSGQVSIDATPFATIHIDGKPVGTTPLLRYELPEGSHEVFAVTEDGRTRRFWIRVRAGKLTAKRLTFD